MKAALAALPEVLLPWYRANARDLPWRHTQDPYRIWVSEIMLQQTRVAAVIGYYDRFLKMFPTVEALADAPEDVLMKQWEGLGYYSRARNLQKAAKEIAAAGAFPDTYETLKKLPGIGEYTAGAIASAAFGRRVPAVDGNVLRVAARIGDFHGDVTALSAKSGIRDAVEEIMPKELKDLRIFNQAMMELGATLCAPNGPPNCADCPAKAFCLGRLRGTAADLPVKAAKKPRRQEEKTVFLLLQNGRVALRRRPDTGLLAGLWEFPNVENTLDEHGAAAVMNQWGFTPKSWKNCLTAKHIFTHVEWHMTGYTVEVSGTGPEDMLFVDGPALTAHAVPSAFARYYTEAQTWLAAWDTDR